MNTTDELAVPAIDPSTMPEATVDAAPVAPQQEPEVDSPQNLLAELDSQQNNVLNELDRLNEQIEQLLRQCSQERSAQKAA